MAVTLLAFTAPTAFIHLMGASMAAAYSSTAILLMIVLADHLQVIEKKLDNKEDKK
jgi:hypothetical protein